MRTLRILTVMTLLALMTACVPSLNPLYTEADIVFDESLIGRWQCDDGEGNSRRWTFTKAEGNSYTLEDLERGDPASFDAKLVKLGDRLYLNIHLLEVPIDNDLLRSLVIRTHIFARITVEGNTMAVELMDPDWLKNQVVEGDQSLEHRKLGDGTMLLTASTEQLRQFIQQHQDDKGVFCEP